MYDIRDYVETNVIGTSTLLEAIVKEKTALRRFVLSSSRAVYGEGSARCRRCGIVFPPLRITVSLAPSDRNKKGSLFDLPMALLIAFGDRKMDFNRVYSFGELGLDGK